MINCIKDGSGDRLKELRKNLNMTQIEFANRLKLSNGHISDMEKDRKNITEPIIKLLVFEFNVNEQWIRTGEGDMFNPLNEEEELAYLMGKILTGKNEFIKQTMLTLAKLDEDDWAYIQKLMNKIKDGMK